MLYNHVLIDILLKTCSSIRIQKAKLYKSLERVRALRARNPIKDSRKKRGEPRYHILDKVEERKKDSLFQKPQNIEERIKCSVRYIHEPQYPM